MNNLGEALGNPMTQMAGKAVFDNIVNSYFIQKIEQEAYLTRTTPAESSRLR